MPECCVRETPVQFYNGHCAYPLTSCVSRCLHARRGHSHAWTFLYQSRTYCREGFAQERANQFRPCWKMCLNHIPANGLNWWTSAVIGTAHLSHTLQAHGRCSCWVSLVVSKVSERRLCVQSEIGHKLSVSRQSYKCSPEFHLQ